MVSHIVGKKFLRLVGKVINERQTMIFLEAFLEVIRKFTTQHLQRPKLNSLTSLSLSTLPWCQRYRSRLALD